MSNRIRRKGGKFRGMDVLFLTTVGAKTGERRETPVAWFPDRDQAWLIVASLGGSARNPGWYHNLAAHPDQVWIEVGDRTLRVVPEQLEGNRREEGWQRIHCPAPLRELPREDRPGPARDPARPGRPRRCKRRLKRSRRPSRG